MRKSTPMAAAGGLSLLAALSLAGPSLAAEEVTDLDAVIVTRLASEPDRVPGLTLITEDDIALRQTVFAADALATVPGVSLSRNGGFGGVSTLRMRGAAGDKTLVLVDGVVQNDASSPNGGFDFAAFDLADIQRIEILAGPQGSLWGSDAIGGVIAFTTRELDGWRVSAEAGSFGSQRGSAAFGQVGDSHAIGASVSAYRSDGVSKAANGTEADGLESQAVSLNGRYSFNDQVSLEGRVRYSAFDAETDGYDASFSFGDTADQARSRDWSGFARLKAAGWLGLDQSLTVSLYDLDRDNISAFSSSYSARRRSLRWTAGKGGPGDRFAVLAGLERDETEASLSNGDRADLGSGSAFVTGRFTPVAPLTLGAALRFDEPDDFDSKVTARLTASGDFGRGFHAEASWGQGFKTPTISQAVCDFCFPSGPSTGLKPETAEGWDLGLSWRSGDERVVVKAVGYRLEVEDQISYGIGRYVNLERTLTTGGSLSADLDLGRGFRLHAAYSHADATDATTGQPLLRVPEQSGAASLAWRAERLNAILTLRAEGEQTDSNPSTFSPELRDGFVTASIAAGWRMTESLELTGRVENLADETFQESLGYREAGRGVFIGLRLRN
ncbi:MAG: TonB-dependent receptor [Caulobacter sp.]|nr:TonB-dependent receptor [Caulobacter sp.]